MSCAKKNSKTVVGLNGITWQEVDTESTIRNHNDAFEGLGDTFNKYILSLGGPNDPDDLNQRHFKAIGACASFSAIYSEIPRVNIWLSFAI